MPGNSRERHTITKIDTRRNRKYKYLYTFKKLNL